MTTMAPLKAVVRNGHLVIDEPVDLPEGTVIELVQADPYEHLEAQDELDDDERARMHAAIDRGLAEIRAGKGIPVEDFIEELKTR